MATQTFAESAVANTATNLRWWNWSPRPSVDAAFRPTGATHRYLSQIRINTGNDTIGMRIRTSPTGSTAADLSSNFEQNGRLEISDGTNSIVVACPDAASNTARDSTADYDWTPSNYAAVEAFLQNAVSLIVTFTDEPETTVVAATVQSGAPTVAGRVVTRPPQIAPELYLADATDRHLWYWNTANAPSTATREEWLSGLAFLNALGYHEGFFYAATTSRQIWRLHWRNQDLNTLLGTTPVADGVFASLASYDGKLYGLNTAGQIRRIRLDQISSFNVPTDFVVSATGANSPAAICEHQNRLHVWGDGADQLWRFTDNTFTDLDFVGNGPDGLEAVRAMTSDGSRIYAVAAPLAIRVWEINPAVVTDEVLSASNRGALPTSMTDPRGMAVAPPYSARAAGTISPGAPTVAAEVTAIRDLTLADFDQSGLIVDALALIEIGFDSASGTYYRHPDRATPGIGTILDGELGVGTGTAYIDWMRWQTGPDRWIFNNRGDADFSFRDYYNDTFTDASFYIQTTPTNRVAVPYANASQSRVSHAWMRFQGTGELPADVRAVLDSLTSGIRVIFAIARPDLDRQVAAPIRSGVPTVGATVTVPPRAGVAAPIRSGAPSVAASLSSSAPPPPARPAGTIRSGVPTVAAGVRLGGGLALSDWDSTGLLVDFAAVIRSSGRGEARFYFGSLNRGEIVEGELGIGPTNVPIDAITWHSTSQELSLIESIGTFDIGDYVEALTDSSLYFQFAADGTAIAAPTANVYDSGDSIEVTFDLSGSTYAALRTGLDAMDASTPAEMIFALARPQPTGTVAAAISSGAPTVGAAVDLVLPPVSGLAGTIRSGAPTVGARLAVDPPDASLSDLQVSPGALNPAFNAETLAYQVGVESTDDTIRITPVTSDPDAVYTILLAGVVQTNNVPADVALPFGTSNLTVRIVAPGMVAEREYALAVTRPAHIPVPPASQASPLVARRWRLEAQLTPGNAYTDITRDFLGGRLQRGKSGGQSFGAVGKASSAIFELRDRDGRYSGNNPNSPYSRLGGGGFVSLYDDTAVMGGLSGHIEITANHTAVTAGSSIAESFNLPAGTSPSTTEESTFTFTLTVRYTDGAAQQIDYTALPLLLDGQGNDVTFATAHIAGQTYRWTWTLPPVMDIVAAIYAGPGFIRDFSMVAAYEFVLLGRFHYTSPTVGDPLVWRGRMEPVESKPDALSGRATIRAYGPLLEFIRATTYVNPVADMRTDEVIRMAITNSTLTWPTGMTNFDVGDRIMPRFWAERGGLADVIYAAEVYEGGYFGEAANGYGSGVIFEKRTRRGTGDHLNIQATLGGDGYGLAAAPLNPEPDVSVNTARIPWYAFDAATAQTVFELSDPVRIEADVTTFGLTVTPTQSEWAEAVDWGTASVTGDANTLPDDSGTAVHLTSLAIAGEGPLAATITFPAQSGSFYLTSLTVTATRITRRLVDYQEFSDANDVAASYPQEPETISNWFGTAVAARTQAVALVNGLAGRGLIAFPQVYLAGAATHAWQLKTSDRIAFDALTPEGVPLEGDYFIEVMDLVIPGDGFPFVRWLCSQTDRSETAQPVGSDQFIIGTSLLGAGVFGHDPAGLDLTGRDAPTRADGEAFGVGYADLYIRRKASTRNAGLNANSTAISERGGEVSQVENRRRLLAADSGKLVEATALGGVAPAGRAKAEVVVDLPAVHWRQGPGWTGNYSWFSGEDEGQPFFEAWPNNLIPWRSTARRGTIRGGLPNATFSDTRTYARDVQSSNAGDARALPQVPAQLQLLWLDSDWPGDGYTRINVPQHVIIPVPHAWDGGEMTLEWPDIGSVPKQHVSGNPTFYNQWRFYVGATKWPLPSGTALDSVLSYRTVAEGTASGSMRIHYTDAFDQAEDVAVPTSIAFDPSAVVSAGELLVVVCYLSAIVGDGRGFTVGDASRVATSKLRVCSRTGARMRLQVNL